MTLVSRWCPSWEHRCNDRDGSRSLETDKLPSELARAKMLMLVDRDSGEHLAVALFDTEETVRRGDDVNERGAW